jgi:hypothetical protein
MKTARADFTLTDLPLMAACPQQTVLAAGGSGDQTAELYDVMQGSFDRTGAMTRTLFGPTATLLDSGKVLITSGGSATAEFYDPTSGQFSSAGGMNVQRSQDTATKLNDGIVLVTGGFVNQTSQTTATTEIFPVSPAATPTP